MEEDFLEYCRKNNINFAAGFMLEREIGKKPIMPDFGGINYGAGFTLEQMMKKEEEKKIRRRELASKSFAAGKTGLGLLYNHVIKPGAKWAGGALLAGALLLGKELYAGFNEFSGEKKSKPASAAKEQPGRPGNTEQAAGQNLDDVVNAKLADNPAEAPRTPDYGPSQNEDELYNKNINFLRNAKPGSKLYSSLENLAKYHGEKTGSKDEKANLDDVSEFMARQFPGDLDNVNWEVYQPAQLDETLRELYAFCLTGRNNSTENIRPAASEEVIKDAEVIDSNVDLPAGTYTSEAQPIMYSDVISPQVMPSELVYDSSAPAFTNIVSSDDPVSGQYYESSKKKLSPRKHHSRKRNYTPKNHDVRSICDGDYLV